MAFTPARPSLRKVLLSLSLFATLISAQTPPTYGSSGAATCPGATDGTNVTVNGGSVYSIYCSSDMGGTFTTVTVASFDECLVACDNNPSCGAAVYNLFDLCYLKPRTSPEFPRFVTQDGANLGIRAVQPVSTTTTSSAAPTNTCPTEPSACPASNGTSYLTPGSGVTYSIACGSDIRGANYGTSGEPFTTTCGYQECFERCNVKKGCLGFVWEGLNGAVFGTGAGQCTFKREALDCSPCVFEYPGGNDDSKCAAIRQDQNATLAACVPVFSTTFTPTPTSTPNPTPTPTPTPAVSSTGTLTCTPAPVATDTTTTNGYCGVTNSLDCGNGFGECCSIYGACGSTSDYCAASQCDPAYGRCGGQTTTNGYCGAASNGALCGSNFGDCCSQYGSCGNTTEYCGAGCDPAYGRCDGSQTPNGYCGATNSGYTCGSVFGDCCSQYGSCGNDTAYCGTGCDPSYGRCDTGTPPTYVATSIPPQYPSGAETSTAAVPTATQIGGTTPNGYCGPDNNEYVCGGLFGSCCSQYGSCGSDAAYCGVGCNDVYGDCDDILPVCSASSSSSSSEIPSTSSSSSSATPIPTGGITENGFCGPANNYWSCGLNFGDCCSQFGACGNSTEYCDGGCLPAYGRCNTATSTTLSTSSDVFSTTESSTSIPDTTITTTTPFPTTSTTTTSTTSLPDTTITTPSPTTTFTTTTPSPTTTSTITTPSPTTTSTTTTPSPTTTLTTTTPSPTTTLTTTTPSPTTTFTTTTPSPTTTSTTTTPLPTTTSTTTTTTPFPTTTITTSSVISSSLISSMTSIPSSSSSSSTATSTTSIGINIRAVCGQVNGGVSCYGSGFGTCCSANNTCGSTDDFCGPGCQFDYGDCNIISSTTTITTSSAFFSSTVQSSIISSIISSISVPASSTRLVATTTTSSSLSPTNTFPVRVPECAKSCLAASDLQGCDPMDVSCICRNNELIADYSCCLALSCSSNLELMAIMAVGRALCACYGYFGLPTSAGCTAPAYSQTPSATLIDQSPTTASTNFVTPTASTCGNILESITDQLSSTTIYSSMTSSTALPPSIPASTTASITATPIPTSALPPCAKPCIATYEQTSCFGGCSPLDVACICSNKVLVDSLSCCVAQTCNGAGQEAVINFAHALCAQYGVFTLPESASCAPTTNPSNGLSIPSSTIPGCASTALMTSATPTPTGLPPCAQPCIASYASSSCYGGCSPLDVACICSNKPLLNELSCCVSTSCDGAGEAEVVRFAHNLCEQYGVFDLPYSAGCASTLAIGASSTRIGSCAATTSGLVGSTCMPCPRVCEKRTTVLAISAY